MDRVKVADSDSFYFGYGGFVIGKLVTYKNTFYKVRLSCYDSYIDVEFDENNIEAG